jgi:hypothetical protein
LRRQLPVSVLRLRDGPALVAGTPPRVGNAGPTKSPEELVRVANEQAHLLVAARPSHERQELRAATGFGYTEQFQHSLAAGRRPFQKDDAEFLGRGRKAVDEAKTAISG